MKKLMLVIAALVVGAAAYSQDVKVQTDTVYVRDTTVIINKIEIPDTITFSHHGFDFDKPFYKKFFDDDDSPVGNIGLGALKTNSTAPFDFNPYNSLEVFFYGLEEIHKGHSWFSYGAGMTWKNFTLTGDTAMSKLTDGSIGTGPFPEGSVPKLSRLRVLSFSFPLLYSYEIGNGFGFTLGPVVNLNAGSCINTKYTVNGNKQKDKYQKVHANIATVDLMFELNLKVISLYAKYSPLAPMDKAYWPDFQYFSFGIAL